MSATGIYGLSGSGIDVESMVKVGMMSKQNQYDKLYKQEVKNEWTKEAYSSLYSDLQTFNSSTMYNYKLSSTTNPQSASSTDTKVATATANADAATMNHNLTVNSMSSNAYLLTATDGIARNSSSASGSIYLSDVIDVSNWSEGDSLSFTIGNGLKTTNKEGKEVDDVKTITLTYEDIVTKKQTLNDLASAIKNNTNEKNKLANNNIMASYDATNDAFTLYNKDGGAANKINITANDDKAAELLNHLGLGAVTQKTDGTTSLGSALSFTTGTATEAAAGTDASVTIDGKNYTADSNKISVGGVTYTFNAIGSTTVSVSQDTDKIIENVKQFVTDYNKMIDSLNDKYYEEQYSDYSVLTKSQESAMTQDQIDKWNEKAKSGLLYHDQTIGKLISSMREAIYTPVDSVDSQYNSMSAIGISSSTNRGHLKLDEDKLKKALAADPDCVRQIFASSGDVTDSNGNTTTDYDSEGVVNRITDKLNTYMKEMKSYAGTSTETSDGSTLGTLIEDLKTKMSNFKSMMDAYETALYKKYDSMESTIQQLISQSSLFSS